MNFHVITIFPEICKAYTDASILGRAQKAQKGKGAKNKGKKITVNYYNPRDFTHDKHRKVDDKPYGGGPGMVMKAEPIIKAWQKAVGLKRNKKKIKTLIMSPRGKAFTQSEAISLAKNYDHLVLISGRYEGVDARVIEALEAEEVSVGDYVLTGGELPALTIIDTVARNIEGVLGDHESLEYKRNTSGESYTRPEIIKYKNNSYKVPEVFLNGHHAEIEKRRKNYK
jgi:tRNA (guanine37-N1)-methyltransferase